MAQGIELTITGPDKIHCASCEERIVRALQRLSGVESVSASAATQNVQVQFDPERTTPEQVRLRLRDMGYETEWRG